ncbi:MAG: response regulator, partial [Propionivibrio sp.]
TFWFRQRVEVSEQALLTPAERPASLARLAGRVLLVEDNEINREISGAIVESLGCQVEFACNGAQAVAAVRATEYDAILMDCQMPVMDGFEATRQIRNDERKQRRAPVPIIALTANALAGDREMCIAAGMNDYLAKPINRAQLRIAIEPFLQVVPLASPVPSAPIRDDSVKENAPAVFEVFDSATLQALPMVADGSDTAFKNRILDLFVGNAAGLITAIEVAIGQGDRSAVQRGAHTLKSASAAIAARALAGRAAELESQLRTVASPHPFPAEDWPRRLRQAYDDFIHALDQYRGAALENKET